MAEFFVWSLPSLIELVEADSEQDAAEEFLGQPATRSPVLYEIAHLFRAAHRRLGGSSNGRFGGRVLGQRRTLGVMFVQRGR
jgi:hypothetical protein